ncbi:MAG: ABC transporter permease subunit [Acetobacteraceae bacterium]
MRLSRAAALGELAREYVLATRSAGAGPLRLMLLVVLPNCLAPLIVQATLGFSSAILDAAALASSAWARSRRRRNGGPCWPMPASSTTAPGGC